MTLVILAAGMGSRYGGLKQLDPITDRGEFIIDFSVYDAIRAGFDKVVFVIKEENLELFRQTIGSRFESKIQVKYVFQDLKDLPEGFAVPEGRVKPWGTAQALLAARHEVHEPFAVINADDFYGKSAYELLAKHLSAPKKEGESEYCMIGYVLENTLTENGTVSRGICCVGEDGYLVDVTERTAIRREGNHAVFCENGAESALPLNAIASMNCWGFTPDIFAEVEAGFKSFLSDLGPNPQKCEYYLPFAVREMMEAGRCRVRVYESDSAWYGVTYHEDKEKVQNSLAELKVRGVYPDSLSNA
ncbi:MAG: nucleotidyltransferase [Clostridia bacterium]|nr:nucleotidyltransferase [Clostridia bacterium]